MRRSGGCWFGGDIFSTSKTVILKRGSGMEIAFWDGGNGISKLR
jgi:hypothetical protein